MDEIDPKLDRLLRDAQSLIARLTVVQRQIRAHLEQGSKSKIPPNYSGVEGDFVPASRLKKSLRPDRKKP